MSSNEVERTWPEDCGTEQPIGVFDVAAVDLTAASRWDCFQDPTVKLKMSQSKANAKRSAAPVRGAPLVGGHPERAIGVASAAGVEVACGHNIVDEEKDAIDAARQQVAEVDYEIAHPQPPLTRSQQFQRHLR